MSLTLDDGDFVTVIGGNGAGKSTMLNAVAGVMAGGRGEHPDRRGWMSPACPSTSGPNISGRVFQDPMMGTAATMQIEENLALAARRGGSRTLRPGITKAEREKYRELLATLDLGLENRLTSKVGLLSGGQRQALTLLMASLVKPRLLLLDEHTAALDPKTAAKVLEATEKIVQRDQLTTLMITHNMRDAIAHGNRLIMMYEGKIVLDIRGEEKKEAHGGGPAGQVRPGHRVGRGGRPSCFCPEHPHNITCKTAPAARRCRGRFLSCQISRPQTGITPV